MNFSQLLQMLRNPSVTSIVINEMECQSEDFRAGLRELSDACAQNNSLREVIINPRGHETYLSNDIAKDVVGTLMSLLKRPQLKSFSLKYHFFPASRLNTTAMNLLCANLEGNRTLELLQLHCCSLEREASQLVPLLVQMPLKSLDLSESCIRGNSLAGLFARQSAYTLRYASQNTLVDSLQYLYLHNNPLSDIGLCALLQDIADNVVWLKACEIIYNEQDIQEIDDDNERITFAWNPSRDPNVLALWNQLAARRNLNNTIAPRGLLPEEFAQRQEMKERRRAYNNQAHRY